MAISDLGRRLSNIPSAEGARHGMIHQSENVYLARGESESLMVILSNAAEPQSEINLRRATLESGVNFRSDSEGDLEDCVVLEFDTSVDSTAVAKVAEHLCHGSPGHRHGDDLIVSLETFQAMLEGDSSGWSRERVVGLWGEVSFLERLISCCENDVQRLACIRSWKSTSIHCSDFVFDVGAGVAIDAKTTSTSNRRHIITSVDQVSLGMHLETGLLSIMIRQVAEGEGWSVGQLIDRIGNELSGQALEEYNLKTQSLSIDEENLTGIYFRERDGRPPMKFRSEDVPGVPTFLPLPHGVPELSWEVYLTEDGTSENDLDEIIRQWISRAEEEELDG